MIGICILISILQPDVDVLKKDYKCGAYQFIKEVNNWIFKTRNCSERIGFICDGDKPYVAQVRSSWLAAEHTCSKRDQHLLQPSTKTLGNNIEDGTIYWVSSFRQKKISWGEDFSNTVCVAAKILTNGNYRLESHFCNESLEALCHKPDRTTYGSSKSDIMTASLGTALGGVLVCITVVAVAIKNRRGHLRTNQTHPQEDMNISPASTGMKMIKGIDEPLYSNSDDPDGDLSIYSFAKDHTEPGENIDTPEKQYDSVTYKEPRNTDEDKHYDHIMEDHYQNPYS